MLITALNQYYDILSSKNKFQTPGYENCDVSYVVVLSPDGKLVGLQDCREEKEIEAKGKKKTVMTPRTVSIPERPRSTTVSANYVEVRPGYIFGLEYGVDKGSGEGILSPVVLNSRTDKQKEKLKLQHQSFCEEVQRDFCMMNSAIAKAYTAFARTWNPESEIHNPFLLGIKADLNKCKFVFCIQGHPETYLQDEREVRDKWKMLRSAADCEITGKKICQCSVTGQNLPVAEVHDALVSGGGIGIRNAGINPSLVNFKPESFLSYNHKQGENACISVEAMKRYTKALNYLLKEPRNHTYLDGQTIVCWSEDGNEDNDSLFHAIFSQQSDQYKGDELDAALTNLMKDALQGTVTTFKMHDIEHRITPDADYYIVGFAPNASRIQVKFLYRQRFGKLLGNVARFQREMQMRKEQRPVPLWKLKREFSAPASTHPELDDAPFDSIFQAVINGTDYPVWGLKRMITRVKKDSDDDDNQYIRLNPIRAGFIKACLIRHDKGEISMSYDSGNDNPAYVCGALFAVLQKIQEDSVSPVKLNRTIKDAYFSAAIGNPASVMPKLIKLSSYHMKKLHRDHPAWANSDEIALADAMNKLGSQFPGTLNLYDQGRFILGYYQRYQSFFKKNEKNENSSNIEKEEEE